MSEEISRPPIARRLGTLESAVMIAVWRQREATVHTVRDAVNEASGTDRAYTTFETVLQRLARKGLLKRRRRGRADVYAATCSEAEYTADHFVNTV